MPIDPKSFFIDAMGGIWSMDPVSSTEPFFNYRSHVGCIMPAQDPPDPIWVPLFFDWTERPNAD